MGFEGPKKETTTDIQKLKRAAASGDEKAKDALSRMGKAGAAKATAKREEKKILEAIEIAKNEKEDVEFQQMSEDESKEDGVRNLFDLNSREIFDRDGQEAAEQYLKEQKYIIHSNSYINKKDDVPKLKTPKQTDLF